MKYIFYDLETTGTNVHWDQIIQFAALVVDEKFNFLDSYESRCSLKKGLIPYPKALLVNNTSISQLQNTNLSHYKLIKEITNKFKEWSPGIFIGYNSISFDEEFLRTTFLKSLFNPYITSMEGNNRGDILNLLRFISLVEPKMIKFSINEKGNKIFKLENIAPINGINHLAHDAMGDVEATMKLAKIIYEKSPEIWKTFINNTSKEGVLNFIRENRTFCFDETIFGKPKPFVGSYLFDHPIYKYPQIFDLKNNPNDLINLSKTELKNTLNKSPKIIRTIKHNKNPITISFSNYNKFQEYKIIGESTLLNRSKVLEQNYELKFKLIKLIQEITEDKQQEDELYGSQLDILAEESLYKSNFPSSNDKTLMEKFHSLDWAGKIDCMNNFVDPRYSYFAKRIIYDEAPDELEIKIKEEVKNLIHKQIFSPNNEKWNTFDKTKKDLLSINFLNVNKLKDEYKFKKDFLQYLKKLEEDYNYV